MSDQSKFDRANRIRQTMAYIRRELDEDVSDVEKSADTLMNWRYYTKTYPWLCVAAVTAIGYMVVPRKLEIHTPDPKTLEKLAGDKHLVVEHDSQAQAKGGLVGAAFSFISGLVLKTAMAQVGHQLASMLQPKQEEPEATPASQQPEHSTSSRNAPELRHN